LKNISIHLRVGIKHGYGIPETEKGMKRGKKRKAYFPLGEFVHANSKKSRYRSNFFAAEFFTDQSHFQDLFFASHEQIRLVQYGLKAPSF
jgi:hypothetical protein